MSGAPCSLLPRPFQTKRLRFRKSSLGLWSPQGTQVYGIRQPWSQCLATWPRALCQAQEEWKEGVNLYRGALRGLAPFQTAAKADSGLEGRGSGNFKSPGSQCETLKKGHLSVVFHNSGQSAYVWCAIIFTYFMLYVIYYITYNLYLVIYGVLLYIICFIYIIYLVVCGVLLLSRGTLGQHTLGLVVRNPELV